jgi:uncharacterized protein YndB with AHSA1/START domain
MIATETQNEVQVLYVKKDILIAAPIDVVFETVVSQTAPFPGDMKLKLEAWPGGRWFRDLGNNTGHLWGHVQVIKPPTLLEITGPLMMSYAVAGHIQYRLAEEGNKTRLTLVHQAIGLITEQHMSGVNEGWQKVLAGIGATAEAKKH